MARKDTAEPTEPTERSEPTERTEPTEATQALPGEPAGAGAEATPTGGGQEAVPQAPPSPDYRDLYLRALAELDNFRKIAARDRRALIETASEGVLRKLLDSVDALERAAGEVERVRDQAPANFQAVVQPSVEGIRAIHRQLMAVLASEGVDRIDPKGEPFDPVHHDAIARVERADLPEGTIIEVVQVGYTLKGTTLRAPRVVVAAPATADAPPAGGAAPSRGDPASGSGPAARRPHVTVQTDSADEEE